jgi:hypothetical protein
MPCIATVLRAIPDIFAMVSNVLAAVSPVFTTVSDVLAAIRAELASGEMVVMLGGEGGGRGAQRDRDKQLDLHGCSFREFAPQDGSPGVQDPRGLRWRTRSGDSRADDGNRRPAYVLDGFLAHDE